MQKRLELTPDLSLADALGGAFATMIAEAEAQARAAVAAPGGALHDYRRAVRRAQAALALTAPMMRKRQRNQLEQELHLATRRTRTLRDLDAVMPVLDRLEREATDPSAEVPAVAPALAAALVALRRYLEAAAAELAGSEIVAWRLRKNVRSLAGLGAIYRAGLHGWVEGEMLLASLRDRYKAVRAAWKAARRDGTGDLLHAWRREARALRYQLELLASRDEWAPAGLAALHELFESQVKALGRVTDLLALAALVEDAGVDALGDDAATLLAHLRELAAAHAAAAFEEAEAVFAVKPKSFAWLVAPSVDAAPAPEPASDEGVTVTAGEGPAAG